MISIQSLLESPNTQNPLMPDIAKQLLSDRAASNLPLENGLGNMPQEKSSTQERDQMGFLTRPSHLPNTENALQVSNLLQIFQES